MYLVSKGIVNDVISDAYGKRGAVNEFGMPTCNFPIEILGVPPSIKSFALVLEDKDSAPSNGFCWIHWLAANIKRNLIEENESASATDFIQGANSWSSKFVGNNPVEKTCFYGGPSPHSGTHTYDLTVYALDNDLDLKNGFYINELFKAMDGHILTKAALSGTYSS